MSTPNLTAEIHYPESDGQPMAETQLHQDCLVRIVDILRVRYAGERVYVAGNMFLYYEEGVVSACVAPDVFVVKGIEPYTRRIYQVWNEGPAPSVVFELTSAATRAVDLIVKPRIYESIGVAEYFLFDPTADYLEPPLQGHRLTPQGFVRLEPNLDGKLESEQLDVFLERQGLELVLRDRKTGQVLETRSEVSKRETATMRDERDRERAAREAAERESEARREEAERERAAREAAEQTIAAMLERIREMEQALARQQGTPPPTAADPEPN